VRIAKHSYALVAFSTLWAIFLLSTGLSAHAQGVYHNQRLFVVPAQGKATSAGDANQTSGAVRCWSEFGHDKR
jgi:hypothetical protein